MIVLDASAAVEWALGTRTGDAVRARLVAERGALHAPHLIDLEVTQAFRRLVAVGVLDAVRAEEALTDVGDLALVRHAHSPLLFRIWELRDSLTVYEAAYVALAEILEAPVVTCDRRAASSRGHRARFEIIGR